MKTKREIVKWLETKKNKAVAEVNAERCAKRNAYFDKRNAEIHLDKTVDAVYDKYQEAIAICEKWIQETDQRDDMRQTTGYYGSMISRLNDANKTNIRVSLLRHFQEDSAELRAIDSFAENASHQITVNYNNVIANVNSAKNNKVAIQYLRDLGFDVSFLEEAAVCTELTVPVDTRWLFTDKKERVTI